MEETVSRSQADLAGTVGKFLAVWGLPIAALIMANWIEPIARTVVWLIALTWMGGACLLNARQCGRRHCYFTGPFFFVMGIAAGLHGFGIVPLGPNGWDWLGNTLGIGGVLLTFVPDHIWGKYVRRTKMES